MIRPFLTKALQPPEDQAVVNALEVLHQLVNHLASLRYKQKATCYLVNGFLLLNNCFFFNIEFLFNSYISRISSHNYTQPVEFRATSQTDIFRKKIGNQPQFVFYNFLQLIK